MDIEKLIGEVIEQIELDIQQGDVTALAELLQHVPEPDLVGFLPEDKPIPTFSNTPRPTESIWGQVDDAEEIMPGMWRVHTPSHGGIIVSKERLAYMSIPLLHGTFNKQGTKGFFEEDCDIVLPLAEFASEYIDYLKRLGESESVINGRMKSIKRAVDEMHDRSIYVIHNRII